jgi:hypothetical protein
LSNILYKFALFVQNEPNFENSKNHRKLLFHKGLRQYARLRITKNKPKTNPNEPKANPIFRSSGAPEPKTNPNKPKANPIYSEPVEAIHRGEVLYEAGVAKPGQTQFRKEKNARREEFVNCLTGKEPRGGSGLGGLFGLGRFLKRLRFGNLAVT